MNLRIFFLLLLFQVLFLSPVPGQGCSDAGACSLNSINSTGDSVARKTRVRLSITQGIGLGEKFTLISQTTAGIQYRLFDGTTLELLSPFIFTYGNLGQTSGVGDFIFSLNQRLFTKNQKHIKLIVAGRLKSNNANFTYGGKPLPMAYQTSLGTNDIITGLLFTIPNWDFYTAYQHPFGRNKNEYLLTDPSLPDNKKYFESAQLKRGDDLYLRVRRELALRDNNVLIFTLLTIFRLQQDGIIKNDEKVLLDGSRETTINLGFSWVRKLSTGQSMELQFAFPVFERAYRADGLTRNAVVAIRFYNL
ncbi:MAG: hypothetical protein L3J66_02205 [Bacteroidales bacterium]|nr:hypothetical protein [Bacteroidales bacterium]